MLSCEQPTSSQKGKETDTVGIDKIEGVWSTYLMLQLSDYEEPGKLQVKKWQDITGLYNFLHSMWSILSPKYTHPLEAGTHWVPDNTTQDGWIHSFLQPLKPKWSMDGGLVRAHEASLAAASPPQPLSDLVMNMRPIQEWTIPSLWISHTEAKHRWGEKQTPLLRASTGLYRLQRDRTSHSLIIQQWLE